MTETVSPQRFDAIAASNAPIRTKPSNYPEPFFSRMAGRAKRPLGELFGLTNFGVNLTTLAPGAVSALFHRHSRQDEFVYIVEGTPTLVTETGGRMRPRPISRSATARQATKSPIRRTI